MRSLTQRRPLTLLGVVLALLVIASFVLVALNSGGGVGGGPTAPVVVATTDLPARTAIPAGSLQVKNIPTSAVPPGSFTSVAKVAGMVPLIDIKQGQMITSNMVAGPDTATAFLPIPTGYVALTIPTGEQQGVAGYIQPGDYISVIATVASGSKIDTKTIFTNLHVVRTGPSGSDQAAGGAGAAASSLTIVVTACQAEYITWFLTYASLKYVLESPTDYLKTQAADPNCPGVTATKGVTVSDVQAQFPSLFQ